MCLLIEFPIYDITIRIAQRIENDFNFAIWCSTVDASY